MITFIQTARRVLVLLGPSRRWRWLLLLAIALLVTVLEAAGAALIYSLLNLISAPSGSVEMPVIGDLGDRFPGISTSALQMAVAATAAAFFLVRSVMVIGRAYIAHRMINNAGADLASHLVRGYLEMPYVEHTRRNSSELVRNAFDSVQSLVRQVLRPLVDVIVELTLTLGLVLVLIVLSPGAMLLAVLVLLPTLMVLMRIVQPRLKALGRRSQDARRDTLEAMQQALGGVRDIRLLRREAEFARSFRRHRRVMARTDYLKSSLSEVPKTLIETALVLVIILVFVLAVVTGEHPTAALSTLGVFAYVGLRMVPSLRKVVTGLNDIRYGTAVVDDLLADRQHVDRILARLPAGSDTPPAPFSESIEFRGVTFTYSDDPAHPSVRDLDFVVRKGEFVGVCGPTGGGKSTLVDLLAGLLRPTMGEVMVDARPLGERPTWWFSQLGVVSQRVFLVDDTLRRNIVFGATDSEIDDDRLHRCIVRAQLEEVVRNLPDGIETVVGEQGVRLSGGQRQRVAIARALYHEPPVLILDEGTSALDSATEIAVVEAMGELKTGHTLIAVAHRISTLRDADRILIVEDGRIVSDGSYDALMQESALFRSLAR